MQPLIQSHEDGNRIDLGPNEVVIRLAAEETDGAFSLVEYTAPPDGPSPGLHRHEETDEVIYVLDGELRCTIDGNMGIAAAGDSVWIPRRTPHTFEVDGTREAWILLWYSPAGFEGYFEEMGEFLRSLPAGPPDMEKVQRKAAELSEIYDQTMLNPD